MRELLSLVSEGGAAQSTYDKALAFGAQICPEILGKDVSVIRRYRESDTVKEFRQKAKAKSKISQTEISPLELVRAEIVDYNAMLKAGLKREETDRLKKRLGELVRAEATLDPQHHTENQVIFRDVDKADRGIPEIDIGLGSRDFQLPDGNVLRLRVLHPDKPEHISGADVMFERHDRKNETVNIVGVQYKIWIKRQMYLNDDRMKRQLADMKTFYCDSGLCGRSDGDHEFRFPHCSAFLRPTDQLQSPDQRLISTGEHVPICQIDNVKTVGPKGGEKLVYDDIRDLSLSHGVFEGLFNTKKLGSKTLTYDELAHLYQRFGDIAEKDRLLIHAQEFEPS